MVGRRGRKAWLENVLIFKSREELRLISARKASRKTWLKGVVGRRGRKAWSEDVAGRRGWKTFLFSRVAKNSHLLKSSSISNGPEKGCNFQNGEVESVPSRPKDSLVPKTPVNRRCLLPSSSQRPEQGSFKAAEADVAQCWLDNLPDTSPPKWFRWSAPSAHASSPLMPADDDVHYMRVVGLQIQSNNQRQLLVLLRRSAQRGLYLVKGQDQGDLGALNRFESCHQQCDALVQSGTWI